MSIQLDTTRLAGSVQMSLPDLAAPTEQGKALAALLGGKSVTVTDGSMSDLEALVARLKNESERAKFLMLMTSLTSIGQSLNEAQKAALEEGLALSEKLDALTDQLKTYEGDNSKAKADSLILQAKIEQLSKQIEQAVEDGKKHNELVAEMKRVREELDAKNQTIADTQGKIDTTKNEISSVKGKISAIVSSIGENSLKTIASELATLTGPEEAESPAEAKKEAEKAAANNPLNAIRESLHRIERELTDTIEENRIETV
ncbi:MAG: hypothetical protein J5727_04860 [Kiritimatiellae bacterium]|nr:hypothetical protein [Kiritimatiellia bacterium]